MKLFTGLALIAATVGTVAFAYARLGNETSVAATGINLTPTYLFATKTPSKPVPTATSTPSKPTVPWSYPAAAGPGIYTMDCAGTGTNSVRVFLAVEPIDGGHAVPGLQRLQQRIRAGHVPVTRAACE